MEKITQSARESSASGPVWETLEQYARGEIQQFVQRLLEEEVEELLGRAKSERRGPETPRGLRNGYGKGPDPSGHPLADQLSEAALVRRGALRDGAAIPADQELPAPRLADTGAAEQTRVHIHRGLTAVTPCGIACISATFGTAPVGAVSISGPDAYQCLSIRHGERLIRWRRSNLCARVDRRIVRLCAFNLGSLFRCWFARRSHKHLLLALSTPRSCATLHAAVDGSPFDLA